MVSDSGSNDTKSLSPNRKLGIMGAGLVILFIFIFKYVGTQPASQSSAPSLPGETAASVTTVASPVKAKKISSYAVSSPDNPVINISTDIGNLKIELYPEYAPEAVKKLMQLIKQDYYSQGTVLESRQGVGFVIAKIQGDVKDFGATTDEVNNLRSERGSVAITRSNVSTAYLNNLFIGYNHQPVLQDRYIIIGQVLDGVEDIEKNSVGKVGQVGSISPGDKRVAGSW